MKILEDLQQKVDEAMESVEAIQGEQFKSLLGFVMSCSQIMRVMSLVSQHYPEDKVVAVVANQIASTMSKGSAMIADAYGFEDDKLKELMKWVETLDSHIVGAMKEASRE